MIKLDRLIALSMLVFSLLYAWLALDYELLPFERNLPFKPNTMPLGLAVAGIVLSCAVLLVPRRRDSSVMDESTVDEPSADARKYDKVRPVILVVLMIFYALSLRPLGFMGATAAFLVFSATVLGERKFHILVPVSVTTAFAIWYVVHEQLGIFLNPWPAGFG